MDLRRLGPSHAVAFQRLRVYALRESPTAFGSSYEEEVTRPLTDVSESLDESSGRTVIGAFIEDQLVGMIGVGREPGIKERHRGFVRSMYVEPKVRSQGIAKALLREALLLAQSMPGLRQITLAVTAGNLAAIAIYEGFAFEAYGTAPKALLVEGTFHDEIHMIRHLGEG